MGKEIIYDKVKQRVKDGVDKVANVVKVTAGPKGKNVILQGGRMGFAKITNDGATAARSVESNDEIEKIGITYVQEACTDSELQTADGTTATAVLLQDLLRRVIEKEGSVQDVMSFKDGMLLAGAAICKSIDAMSKPIKDDGKGILQVATISTNNDEVLGKALADAFDKVGERGVISVEEAMGKPTSVSFVEGFMFDRGLLHPYMVNDHATRTRTMENVRVLVTDANVTTFPMIAKVVEMSKKMPILIVAKDFSEQLLTGLVMGMSKGEINLGIVKAPGVGDNRLDMTEDLCAAIGARFLKSDSAGVLGAFKEEDLGKVKRVIIGKDTTTIIGGNPVKDVVEGRIENIVAELDSDVELEDYRKGILNDRLAMLRGGVALIKLGAYTDTEYTEKKLRMDDAIGATRSAIEEGIVPGGGLALILAKNAIEEIPEMSEDKLAGFNVVMEAVNAPFNNILNNAGYARPRAVWDKIKNKPTGYGLNVKTDEYGMMWDMGIVDPAKVVKASLMNALSVVAMVSTSEVIVCESNIAEF